jgi:hypothetical protein
MPTPGICSITSSLNRTNTTHECEEIEYVLATTPIAIDISYSGSQNLRNSRFCSSAPREYYGSMQSIHHVVKYRPREHHESVQRTHYDLKYSPRIHKDYPSGTAIVRSSFVYRSLVNIVHDTCLELTRQQIKSSRLSTF